VYNPFGFVELIVGDDEHQLVMSLMRKLICRRVRAILTAVAYSQGGVHHDDASQGLHDVFEELRAVEPMPLITVSGKSTRSGQLGVDLLPKTKSRPKGPKSFPHRIDGVSKCTTGNTRLAHDIVFLSRNE
jgi:hypothetical protein